MLPSSLRRKRWVQKLLAGIEYRQDGERMVIRYPDGTLVYCPSNDPRNIGVMLKSYLDVAYYGQYFKFWRPQAGDVVIDIGANLGLFALAVGPTVGPEGHVYLFEPGPENAACLEMTMAANGIKNWTVVPAAVGDRSGSLSLDVSGYWHDHTADLRHGGVTIEVPVTTVDEFAAKHDIARIDLIKADVEGMEAEVLRGATETLRRDGPRLAFSGYHHPDDVEVLPALMKDLQPGYVVQWEEQVLWGELDLFAHVPTRSAVEARTA